MQVGWEYVEGSTLLADARRIGEEAVQKLKAPSVKPGKKDLVLAPSNLWRTIHEKDVAYQSNTLEFWNKCERLGGAASWELHGTLHDGKGEPVQSNAVSHGFPPALFRQIDVLNTNRRRSA